MEKKIAIVGRPNVGKSSLFNRIIGDRVSIVHDSPGVTRDRIYSHASWLERHFIIIDTGGIQIENVTLQEKIKLQTTIAINEADIIIFMIDGQSEITNDDLFIYKYLKKNSKKLIVVANKTEGKNLSHNFYSLGEKNIFMISTLHGIGIGNLLDEITKDLSSQELIEESLTKLSLIGRPNVGKSTLFNLLINENRSIVSQIAGTTRDSINSNVTLNNSKYNIIDTAGIIKKSKLVNSIEHYALIRAMNSLDSSDVALLLIDAFKGFHNFDSRIVGYALERKKPIILVINKWDLIKDRKIKKEQFSKDIKDKLKFIPWIQIVFISAINKKNINNMINKIQEIENSLKKTISTNLLNNFILDLKMMKSAPSHNGGELKISFVKKINGSIPKFLFFVNNKKYAHFSYMRFIENRIREYFGFFNVPINIILKNKGEK